MKVSEFIEWLKTQDQGATVEILVVEQGRDYRGDTYSWVDFHAELHSDYLDMRGNEFAKGKPYENSRTLRLGEE